MIFSLKVLAGLKVLTSALYSGLHPNFNKEEIEEIFNSAIPNNKIFEFFDCHDKNQVYIVADQGNYLYKLKLKQVKVEQLNCFEGVIKKIEKIAWNRGRELISVNDQYLRYIFTDKGIYLLNVLIEDVYKQTIKLTSDGTKDIRFIKNKGIIFSVTDKGNYLYKSIKDINHPKQISGDMQGTIKDIKITDNDSYIITDKALYLLEQSQLQEVRQVVGIEGTIKNIGRRGFDIYITTDKGFYLLKQGEIQAKSWINCD